MPADGYGGAIWQSLSSKACKKERAKDAPWEVLFWTLDDRGKGSKSGREQVECRSRTGEAGVKRKSLERPLLI